MIQIISNSYVKTGIGVEAICSVEIKLMLIIKYSGISKINRGVILRLGNGWLMIKAGDDQQAYTTSKLHFHISDVLLWKPRE
jgi:hypothetical protein